jgi:adenosylcobinamide-phosphate synthase
VVSEVHTTASWRARASRRCAGAAVGLLADRLLGEPPALAHPVTGFGRLMTRWEHALLDRRPIDDRTAGALFALIGVATALSAARALPHTAAATALCASGRMLRCTAMRVGAALERGDLPGARAQLPALVGRDPARLDEFGVAAAVVESVAENTVDAVVAPALWAAAGGAPGVAVHRAVNTLDAMVGHRSARYARFGTASARLDDAMAFVPARVTALLVAAVRPALAGRVLATVRRDAAAHPSPNAGVAEAAFAAALGVELGGPVHYAYGSQARPHLGAGRRPKPRDVARACRLSSDVEVALIVGLAVLAAATRGPARRRAA